MPLSFWFWFLMVLWLVLGFWRERLLGQPYLYYRAGGHLLLFLLLTILGWHDFGAPWNSLVSGGR
jgi:hypothetical protein